MLEGKDHYRILSAIKRTFSRSSTAIAARNAAKYVRKKGPRGGARYKCKDCKKAFGATGVQVDHRDPCVPIGKKSADMSWDELVSRIYCHPSNLDVLCIECHKLKSKQEAADRKAMRIVKKPAKDPDSVTPKQVRGAVRKARKK